ncbi:hypothetical protein HYV84_01730 [Candidatus Woesearchaeota archaeon]|nr:hypothetical protein [Candidatus Woesearchaeota archaeon]
MTFIQPQRDGISYFPLHGDRKLGLKDKLEYLAHAGYQRETALKILKLELQRQHREFSPSPFQDALSVGPEDFDVDWYELQFAAHTPESLRLMVTQSEISDKVEGMAALAVSNDDPSKALHDPSNKSVSWNRILYPGLIAAGVGLAFFAPALAIAADAEQPGSMNLDFGQKVFDFPFEGQHYKVTLLGRDDYSQIQGPLEALEKLKDDSQTVMLVGDFTPEQIDVFKRIIAKYEAINPRIVGLTEMIFLKLNAGHTSAAIPNCFSSSGDFGQVVQKYVGTDYKTHDKRTYTQKVDLLKKGQVKIPLDENDYQNLMDGIVKNHRQKRPDCFDVLLSGIQGMENGEFEKAAIHEMAHIADHESPDSYQLYQKLRESSGFSLGRDIWANLYVMSQAGAVEDWVNIKTSELEKLIAFYDGLSPKSRKEMLRIFEKEKEKPAIEPYYRLFVAVDSIGLEKTRELYKGLLEEAALDWRLAEQIAEEVVEVVNNSRSYQNALQMKSRFDAQKAARGEEMKKLKERLASGVSRRERKAIQKKIAILADTKHMDRMEQEFLSHYFVGEFLKAFGNENTNDK